MMRSPISDSRHSAGTGRVRPGGDGRRRRTAHAGWHWAILGWLLCQSRLPAATEPPDPAAPFFAPASLQTIRLEIPEPGLERMERALPRRIQVPGTFQWNDHAPVRAEIRYMGGSSSIPGARHKRAFLVTFPGSDPASRFLGLRHVALDNGIQFGSVFSECLVTDILRGVGVKASRCNHARVVLNGRPAGVFVNVERIDRAFLEHRFPPGDGALFKVDEGGPGADLLGPGVPPAGFRDTFELHAGEEEPAYAALAEFIRAVNDPALPATELERRLDLEAFLKTTAVLLLAGAFDQYTGWNPHNYYLHLEPARQRWTYVPWDLDVGFADHAFGRIPVLEGWHAAWPAPAHGRPLMERVVGNPDLLRRYRAHAREILETWFRPEVLIPRLRALHARIRSALDEDPHPPRRVTVPSDTGMDDILASMERFIRQRYALARDQLDVPGDRPAPKPMPPGPESEGPAPGPRSADAPANLRATRVGPDGVELAWEDRAADEVAHVVQRCTGGDCADFVNAIGQGGPAVTTAFDPHVQPGTTYRYRAYAVRATPRGPRGTGVSNVITVRIPPSRPTRQ